MFCSEILIILQSAYCIYFCCVNSFLKASIHSQVVIFCFCFASRNKFFPSITFRSLVEKVKASASMKKHYPPEVALVEVKHIENDWGAEGSEPLSNYTQLREELLEYCET